VKGKARGAAIEEYKDGRLVSVYRMKAKAVSTPGGLIE
jgi:hypothetical protein